VKIGTTIRNMGSESSAEIILQCARAAEARDIESVWITDHIAIPPDDAEGSGGRYLDTLTTLAWLAAATARVKLGSGVLIVPYRAKLPTAKQIATVQELSGGRLLLGVGIGWMDPEFRALGVDRHQRGKLTDEALRFFNECFAADEVSLNGQRFLFKPRPPKPPILVGGAAPHALRRAAELGDGWLPMAREPGQLAAAVAEYRQLTKSLGRPRGNVTVMTALPLAEAQRARAMLAAYREMGVDRLVCAIRYADSAEYATRLDELQACLA
jgi:probable F420-dependent oxidoreductase